MRVLTEISQISKGVAARHGIELVLTFELTLPAAPILLEPGNIPGSPPPAITPGKRTEPLMNSYSNDGGVGYV
jgi:hypothetical protein